MSRFWYHRVDRGTTESILVLQVDFGTTESILVLQSRFWYYRVDFDTTESILVLQSRFRYCRVDFGITESILVLQSRFLVLQNHKLGDHLSCGGREGGCPIGRIRSQIRGDDKREGQGLKMKGDEISKIAVILRKCVFCS